MTHTSKGQLFLVVLILILGFVLRVVDVGAAPLQVDEAWVAYLAYSEGHLGVRPEMGMKTSTGIDHSPLLHDVLSLSFTLDPDPRLGRLYNAGLHLIAMALLYLLVRRFWSAEVGIATLLLYIAVPRGVMAGRYLWNPYLVAPFLIGYFMTGLMIVEGKRFARWLHPACYICAVQMHPAIAVFAPMSLVFYGIDLWRHRARWRIVRDDAIGVFVAAVLLVPWGMGLLHQNKLTPVVPHTSTTSVPGKVFSDIAYMPFDSDFGALGIPAKDFQHLTGIALIIAWGIGIAALMAAIVVLLRALLVRRRFREGCIAAGYLLMPVLMFVLPLRSFSAYFIPLIPLGAAVGAILLFGDHPKRTFWRWGLILVMLVFEIGVNLDWLAQVHNFNNFSRGSSLSLNAMLELRNEAVRPGIETIYLVDGADRGDFVQTLEWLTYATQGESRVLWGTPSTLPVPQKGATYVGYNDAVFIPELYTLPTPRLVAGNLYRVVDLPPNSGFTPTCTPASPKRLSNGATILGYYVPANRTPTVGQPWTFYLLWRGVPVALDQGYQTFVHLVEENGTKHAQQDVPVPFTALWRQDDLYVTRFQITPDATLPTHGKLFVRVGMYTLPDIHNADLLDDSGNPSGTWVTIPVC
jgi:hypothetical protein